MPNGTANGQKRHCVDAFSSPAFQWPQHTSLPLPQPNAHSAWGKLLERHRSSRFWRHHCVMRVNKEQEERSTDIPVYKEEPPHREGAATAKAPPQSHPMPQILNAEPAAGSRDVQGCCAAHPLRGSQGEKTSETCKGCVIRAPGQSAVAVQKACQSYEPSRQANEC